MKNHYANQFHILKQNVIDLTVLGLCCCMGFSLVSVRGGNSLVAVHELLITVASLWSTDSTELGFQKLQHVGSGVVVPGLEHRLGSCGIRA